MTRLASHIGMAALATALIVPFAVGFASAQSTPTTSIERCGPRADMAAELERTFQEKPQALGLVDKSAVVEVFVSDAGTWTIVATGTDGTSCILSAGEGWEANTLVRGADA